MGITAIKYRADRKGVRELSQSRDIQNGMVKAAEIVRSAAVAMPLPRVGNSKDRRGYVAAFQVKPNMAKPQGRKGNRRGQQPRAGAMVINDHELERLFGRRNRTLYRALDALKGVTIQ